MNAYLITDFLLRLKVPAYLERRMSAHPIRAIGARGVFDEVLGRFLVHPAQRA